MTTVTFNAMRAKEGDALLLHCAGVNVLIDAGPPGVYRKFVKRPLEALDDGGVHAPFIDLLMVSHIDSDHIAGVLDLTKALIQAQDQQERPIVQVREAWHNSFDDTLAGELATTNTQVRESAIEAASIAGVNPLIAEHMPDARVVLESVGQGRRLRHDLGSLAIDVNKGFARNVVLRETATNPWQRGPLTITVIGPGEAELERLKTEWARQLPKILKKEQDKAAAASAAQTLDDSVSNLASIVAIAQVDNKRILLTGDARGDMIMEWLENSGHADGRAHFDILKIPHHGSSRNVSRKFFKKVTADHYVMSGNGKHGNPDPETFKMLFEARPDDDYLVHMTYGPEELSEKADFDADLFETIVPPGSNREERLRFPASNERMITLVL